MPNALERLLALLGLIAASPALVLSAVAVLIETGRPVLFRQKRIGRHGIPFVLLKLRSMAVNHGGPSITRAGEARITRVGAFLRKTKLDELLQLINVLRGDMSLVGPRPEVPEYVDLADPRWRRVLAARPGITDPASLEFRDEEELLTGVDDLDRHYREVILPRKLELAAAYLERRTWRTDLALVFRTAGAAWLLPFFSDKSS